MLDSNSQLWRFKNKKMGSLDTFIRDYIAYPVLPVIIVLLVLYLGKDYFHSLRKKAFASLTDKLCSRYNAAADHIKRDLFNSLEDINSGDWKLKNEGRIRILEIGIGTGANLKYFPKNCQLMALDNNEEMKKLLLGNCKKYPHIQLEKFIVADAEDMREIKDSTVDAVVCTLVLCSAYDSMKILQEVKRVLVPGGKFLYLEHVHADDGTFLNKIQSILSVSKLWPLLFLGCELNRHTGETIEKAGFSKVNQKKVEVKGANLIVLSFIRSHVCGVAIK